MNTQFDNRFDELFNQKFSGFEKTPPDYILDKVKTSINQQSALSKIGNFYKNNFIVAGLSILVPALIIGFYAFSGDKSIVVNKNGNTTQTAVVSENVSENNNAPQNLSSNNQNTPANISTPPAAIVSITETCGLTYRLQAKNNNGKWTSSDSKVNFASQNNSDCIVQVQTEGSYKFKWVPADESQSIEHVTVKFKKQPLHDKTKEMGACNNEVTLEAKQGSGSGTWTSINNVVFKNATNSKTTATYNGTGKVCLIWSDNAECAIADTFNVLFAEKTDASFNLVSPLKCSGSPAIMEAKNKSYLKYEWDVDGGTATDLTAHSVNVSWKEGSTHKVTLKTWANEYCFSSFTSVINHPKPIDVTFDVQPATCAGAGSIRAIPADTKASYQYYWMKEREPAGLLKNNMAPGKYQLTVRENGLCSRAYFVEVPGIASVKASFYHSNYESNLPATIYFVNTSASGGTGDGNEEITYEWNFGDGTTSDEESPKHTFMSSGLYKVKLTATSKHGCSDTYVMSDINIDPSHLTVPNVFSPNGDGKNDVFRVKTAALNEFHAVVSGSKGEKVFEWSDPEAGWDGTILKSGAKAAPGIYYYIVKAVGKDGNIYEDKGTVQLVRE